jgi:hypothetical protein
MTKTTDAELEKIIKIINSNIPDEWDQLGLRGAYGSTGISTHEDSYDVSGLMTKGEVKNFLRGFQAGMSLGRKIGKSETLLDMVKEAEALNG